MKSILVIATILLFAFFESAGADTLVDGATITKVLNSRSENDSSFVVFTQGGTGPCTNGVMIAFYPSGGSDAEKLKRAYAAALTALTIGYKVTISNDTNNSCTSAVHIAISPP